MSNGRNHDTPCGGVGGGAGSGDADVVGVVAVASGGGSGHGQTLITRGDRERRFLHDCIYRIAEAIVSRRGATGVRYVE